MKNLFSIATRRRRRHSAVAARIVGVNSKRPSLTLPLHKKPPSWQQFCYKTMSRRTLGGGRILGSGKSLSPALPPAQKQHAQNLYLSPSASTLSLGSGDSTPPSSESQDLTSRISADHGDTSLTSAATGAGAGARMVCPICNEEMVTLLQLNRHLDD